MPLSRESKSSGATRLRSLKRVRAMCTKKKEKKERKSAGRQSPRLRPRRLAFTPPGFGVTSSRAGSAARERPSCCSAGARLLLSVASTAADFFFFLFFLRAPISGRGLTRDNSLPASAAGGAAARARGCTRAVRLVLTFAVAALHRDNEGAPGGDFLEPGRSRSPFAARGNSGSDAGKPPRCTCTRSRLDAIRRPYF